MPTSESLRQVAQARAPWSAWFGIVMLFVLFGAIVLAIIGPAPRGNDYEEARAKKRAENLKALREETDNAMTTYSWIDKNKGVARIPVDRAMELTVAELAKQKPAPAGPIATPETQAAPGAPASPAPASPAPAGSPQPQGTQRAGSPPGQAPAAPASPSPAAQSSPPATISPAPAKTP
jgi:hypothetical protein